jgi:50S ribosomal protein L16 3-hydroxylase
LVQGLDLHLDAAHDMLRAFDFIAQARLDDLMLSYASDGGGVGPHVDSYDVFLLQVQGRRRWRIAPPGDDCLLPGLPLRILSRFEPQQEWVLEPGDMLYLPPGWGHDGVARGGDCMTASIGFRAPRAGELAAALLQRMADELTEAAHTDEGGPWVKRHADPGMAATASTGAVPQGLEAFAHASIARATQDKAAMARALGAWLTEPKPKVWFEANAAASWQGQGVVLDRRTRMAYDERHLFINGEAFRVGGLDSRLLRHLADDRRLDAKAVRRLSPDAREAAFDWVRQGWLHLNQ